MHDNFILRQAVTGFAPASSLAPEDEVPAALSSFWPLWEDNLTRKDVLGVVDMAQKNNDIPAGSDGTFGYFADLPSPRVLNDSLRSAAQVDEMFTIPSTSPFTVACWARLDAGVAHIANTIMSSYTRPQSGTRNWQLINYEGYYASFEVYSPPTTSPIAAATLPSDPFGDNAWHLITGKYDYAGGYAYISLDAGSWYSDDIPSQPNWATRYANIGGHGATDGQGDQNNWAGDLRHAMYFESLLTDDAVAWLYNSGAGQSAAAIAGSGVVLPPTNLTGSPAVGPNAANLAWEDRANNETGYTVERSQDAANWGTIATLAANTESYVDDSPSHFSHYYRVRATGVANSIYSNIVLVEWP